MYLYNFVKIKDSPLQRLSSLTYLTLWMINIILSSLTYLEYIKMFIIRSVVARLNYTENIYVYSMKPKSAKIISRLNFKKYEKLSCIHSSKNLYNFN